uniref:Protein HGH1 homolog n=1 Tax=Octactis speculum TaxID=3111310 RepID=A0A7S2GGE5_9STRA|mmetsp:Transcript_46613/g.63466  ORF Transcript_46613/g.63466 Transcript_46613/m.63466 type:complete len:400 (+) Transcript_46613:1-1200(+)
MDVVRCTDGVLAAALSALVNVTHASASNQNLLVELNGVEPAIIACKKNSDSHVLEQAARLIGNTCFNNTYTGEQILSLQGDAALCLLIKVCDLTVDHRINEGCLIALRNLCTHEPNQTLVAGSDAVTLAVHVCHHSREPCLLTAAATLLTALGFSCPTNKSIIGDAGGLPALLAIVKRYLTSRSGNHDTANYHSDVGMTVAVEEACRALGSLLLHEGSRISMQKLGGLKLLANLVMETTEELGVLQTSAMPFCAMCPTAEERYHAHDEGRHLDYMVGVLDVLTVIRNSLASKRKQPPVWVDDAIDILSLDEDGLLRAKLAAQEIMPSDSDIVEEKGVHDLDGDVSSSSEEGQTNTGRVVEKPLEFFTRLSLFEERESLVMADHVVTTSLDLESLLFQVF